MNSLRLVLIWFVILSLRTAIVKSVENIEVQSSTSPRKNRQLYQAYASKKFIIPHRQSATSAGQLYTPSNFQNFQILNQQGRLLVKPSAAPYLNQQYVPLSVRPISTNNGGSKFMFPDEVDTSYTFKQTIQQQPHQEQTHSIRQNFNKPLGSYCQRTLDNKNGYCLFAHQCLHIIREFRLQGVKLDICSYNGSIPVICCPPENKVDATFNAEDLSRISAKKCVEYNNFGIDMLKPSERANHAVKKCELTIPLIVGGEETLPGEFPHMAAIGWIIERGQINWACGGTLISERYVLTAAHCTILRGKPPDRIKLGAQHIKVLKQEETSIQEFKISEIISHPKYNKEQYYYDIALIKLSGLVKLSKYVRPACLWFRSKMDDVDIVTATGWGRTRYLGRKSNNLLKVDLQIVSNEKCNELYNREIKLHKGIVRDQFCAGYLEGGKDTCQGDSGGPINVQMGKYNCVNYVIGITSFGKFCAAPNSPGVYTKINSYLDWIESIAFKY